MEILWILPGFIVAIIVVVLYEGELRVPKNNVHFYVTRDSDPFNEGLLTLWLNKPERGVDIWYVGKSLARDIAVGSDLVLFGLSLSNYKNLKWEDEPIEVFLNLEIR